MRFSSRFAFLLGLAAAGDLNGNEAYLEPYEDQLLDVRVNSVSSQYVSLAGLVDFVPGWLENLFVPLLAPGGEVSIPVNAEVDFKVPVSHGRFPIKIPASFTVVNVTLNNLNTVKHLKPLKLADSGKYTWHSQIDLNGLDISASIKLKAVGQEVDVNVGLTLANPSVDAMTILALNQTRLCEVWGHVMFSSLECAAWPVASVESAGVSGINITDLQISISDFDFQLNVHGLGINNTVLQSELDQVLEAAKPTIISTLPGNISQAIRSWANNALLHSIPQFHRDSPCKEAPELAPPSSLINVSRVCVSNNGAYVLRWEAQNCPAHKASSQTKGFDVDQTRCMDMTDVFPEAVEGDILRFQTQIAAGLRGLQDPAMRYVPKSNAAAFECSGTTLDYSCPLVSLVPVDSSILAPVQTVCIINHAGFVMYYKAKNEREQNTVYNSGHYPINKKKCIDLGITSGAVEGDEFSMEVKAILGKTENVDRNVVYSKNQLTATYECTGTTLHYHCRLLVGAVKEDVEIVV